MLDVTRRPAIRRTAGAERGAVLVIVALMLPVLISFSGIVLDVGNWFAHKRHLQTQADSGALAGAGKFRFPCTDAPILDEVSKYTTVDDASGYNPQIGTTPLDELHEQINSPTWYDQSSPVDDTVRTGGPCAAKMIDVKLTETDLPWWLKLAKVPYINTHARVEIRQKVRSTGALPVGVPEVGPRKAKAIFVDEATGDVLASTPLTRSGTSPDGLPLWSNIAAPVGVTVDRARIGVRILLSGSTAADPQCGDPLVNCYGAGTNSAIVAGTPGLSLIRGWSTEPAGTATAPQIRDASLFTGSCTENAYFTATSTADPCTIGVRATLDGLPSTATVFAQRATGANTKVPLTFADGVWTSSAGLPITAGEGPVSIRLFHGSGSGTLIGTAHRAFAGNESLSVSGPIKMLRLSEGSVAGTNSFERCATCTHSLVVTLGLKPGLQEAQTINDPIVSLKVAGGGSQNQGLDCDPALPNIRDELAQGCGPEYVPNPGQACPTGNWRPTTPQPWNCVVINTGATVGQVTQGMNLRILGAANSPACDAPNDWASFPDFRRDDPRIVEVFVTPFGAFSGSGGDTVPVTAFATFYVTGWDGGGCQNQGDDPAGQGAIVGHFIDYVYTLGGGGGEETCEEAVFGSCVAVFTR